MIFFLLALREVEDGAKGSEFNIKVVNGTDLETQTAFAVDSIIKNRERWHDYIRDQSRISFVKFFCLFGGPMRTGWHSDRRVCWIRKMDKTIKEISNEFDGVEQVGK